MPLLDIAVSQPCFCFRNNLLAFRSRTDLREKVLTGNDWRLVSASTFSGRNGCIGGKVGKDITTVGGGEWRSRLMVKAVGTLEIARVPCQSGGKRLQNVVMMDVDSVKSSSSGFEPPQSSSEDSTDVGESERLRRMRISKANKGNTPWNKGRKHSPETLRRIKERTRLAMQNPKVKAKLVNFGHAQSEETRLKIAAGVRLGWQKRRAKLILQDTCYYEWQNLIAETAQKGFLGEEKLEWDSYKILDEQLEQQWLQSAEKRKTMPRLKASKRAPKSAEQKRRISEAIAAKWADPDYRDRVYSGIAKYHGIAEGAERKPKRKPTGDVIAQKRSPENKDEKDDQVKRKKKSRNQLTRRKRSRSPLYKDPLASAKLEMLKNIRAQRATIANRESEAIIKAKLLISEAEKAAKALEIAAKTNPLAHASLMESRMLIAEAHKLIESIGISDAATSSEDENGNDLSESSTEPVPEFDDHLINPVKVNGAHSIPANFEETDGFGFDELGFLDFINGNSSSYYSLGTQETFQQPHQKSLNGHVSSLLDEMMNYSDLANNPAVHKPNPNGISVHTQNPLASWLELRSDNVEAPQKEGNKIKKWVRGRLLDVAEEET